MKKLKRNQMRHDVAPLPDGIRAALFVEGIAEPVTPAAAYTAWTAGESESAAAARQRMIDRHGGKKRSETAADGRENMIRRGGGKGNGAAQ